MTIYIASKYYVVPQKNKKALVPILHTRHTHYEDLDQFILKQGVELSLKYVS